MVIDNSICLHDLPSGYPEQQLLENVNHEGQARSIYCLKNKMYICFECSEDLDTPIFSDGDTLYETKVGPIKLKVSRMTENEYKELADLEKNAREWEDAKEDMKSIPGSPNIISTSNEKEGSGNSTFITNLIKNRH